MSDAVAGDEDDGARRAEDERRRAESRRRAVANMDDPDAAPLVPNARWVFDRLGYDVRNFDDIERLNKTIRFAEGMRLRHERIEANKLTWAVMAFLAILGALVTPLLQFLTAKKGG